MEKWDILKILLLVLKYRGYGLGKKMIELLSLYAKEQGCYKCILDCSDDNVGFYEKCDYVLCRQNARFLTSTKHEKWLLPIGDPSRSWEGPWERGRREVNLSR